MPTRAGESTSDVRPEGNLLLASLPREVVTRLSSRFEVVSLHRGRCLYVAGDHVSHAVFPLSGLVSLSGSTVDGGTVEILNVANDGFLGLPLRVPNGAAHTATVLADGRAVRMSIRLFINESQREPALQRMLLEWADYVLAETSQAVVCHRFHRLLDRLCRWLLTACDRLHTDRLALTQEDLARALGSPRTVVSAAAIALQDAGAIAYRHGRIAILNRRRLELSACECYGVRRALSAPFVDLAH